MAIDDVVNLRPGFSLWLRNPILQSETPFVELSTVAENFDMRIACDGSDYMSFRLSANEFNIPFSQFNVRGLIDIFNKMIAGDIRLQTDTQEVVWRGFLKSMILSAGGMAEIIDLENMYNQAIADHTLGSTAVLTDPTSGADSIAYYGAKLIRITDTSDLVAADATLIAQNYLKLNSWARPMPYSGDNRDSLEFFFVGYIYMLDWQEDTITAPLTVKAAIEQVITNTGQGIINFVADSIQDNGQVWNSTITGTGLELIRKLTNMLDSAGNVWNFWIDTNNIAHYEPVDFQPYYYRRSGTNEADSGIFIDGAKAETFTGKAGVILRDMTYPITTPPNGSPFISRQDRFVEAVRFNKDGEIIVESLVKYDEAWSQTEQYKVNKKMKEE